MTETFLKVEQPAAPENPTVKVRNVATVVGSNTVLHQVTMSAKEDGTIIPPASETKQDTGNASLSSIDTKTPALGQALASGSVPSVLPQSQIDALTPPAAITGFSTSAKQDVLQAAVGTTSDAEAASGDGTLVAILKACRTKLSSIVTAVTGTLTVGLPTGAATAAKQPALGTAGVASTDVITVQGIASGVSIPTTSTPAKVSTANNPGSQVSLTTSVSTLLAPFSTRSGLYIVADVDMFVKFGAGATTTAFKLEAGQPMNLNGNVYTGAITAILSTGTGTAYIMEW